MTMCKFVFNHKKDFIKQILNSISQYIKKKKISRVCFTHFITMGRIYQKAYKYATAWVQLGSCVVGVSGFFIFCLCGELRDRI